MSYAIELDVFSGPLDLLLKLIDEHKVDIYDIPIAYITDQYIETIHQAGEIDLDILSDFLVMAATLIRIKAKMLAPRHKEEESEAEEEEDPRMELVHQLVEYRRFKAMARQLVKRYEGDTARVYYRDDEVIESEIELQATLNGLMRAFRTVWLEKKEDAYEYEIPRSDVDIGEKMIQIMVELKANRGEIQLEALFRMAETRREALAIFLGLLELIRLGQVGAVQDTLFGPITISTKWDVGYAG